MKRFYWKVYAVFIVLTLLTGAISGLISNNGIEAFKTIEKSPLTPPGYIFSIVWTVLYILMGIGAARIFLANDFDKGKSLAVFAIQLVVNFLWSPIFFNLKAYGFAFLWIILLWLLIIAMILLYAKVDKVAAILQMPYLLWVTFAAYLTFTTWMLNR